MVARSGSLATTWRKSRTPSGTRSASSASSPWSTACSPAGGTWRSWPNCATSTVPPEQGASRRWGATATSAPGGTRSRKGHEMSRLLEAVTAHIREQAAAYCEPGTVPGYLAGVYHDGAQTVVAHGLANAVTRAPMREHTGFLFGSVTKLLTTTLVLQQAERGTVDLDDRVIKYLPEFKLTTPAAAEQIRVRNLLTHTNGIDADLFFPDAKGRDALKIFLEGLGRYCGALFAPDEYTSYSNGGMIVAGRLLEAVTRTPYHDLLKRELYATASMDNSCTSAEEAILRSTAVGHFPDPATGGARRTSMFMLPDTWAPAGATPIGTIGDLLAFGRSHLAGGLSPTGTRVLSRE